MLPDVPSWVYWLLGILGVVLALAVGILAWLRPRWVLAPFQPKPRNVLAWVLAVATACGQLLNAWWVPGHATCDFANQWLMGRMVYLEQADKLYFVGPESEALATGFSGV